MILADTSAWVEYDRASGSAADQRLTRLIADNGPLAITEPVIMEIAAGARTAEREGDLRRLVLRFHLLQFDPAADFDGAATIYRRCRRAGVTPRGLIDCMIAAIAHRHGATLLAHDADLGRVANVVGIEMDPASLTTQRAERGSRGR
jgi:predicted nucleic acid-binding protein